MATTPPGAAAADDNNNYWRNALSQVARNDEVKEIANFLAQLEPGASSTSKMGLAMRFEDGLFKQAKSYEDYKKKIQKRLKKLQKNYKPEEAVKNQNQGNVVEQLLLELRSKYAEHLRYIDKNADKAVEDIRERYGEERSGQLRQHTNCTKQWAQQLGVLEDTPPPNKLSEGELLKLSEHLNRRVENIRQYVVKHAEPDLFLQETLEKKDKELSPKASEFLAKILTKRVEQLRKTTASSTDETPPFDATATLLESLERCQASLQAPTRNNEKQIEVPNALKHLDKMRAASSALMAYLAIPGRKDTAPPNTLAKTYKATSEGLDFVVKVAKNQKGRSSGDDQESEVKLEDAWNKPLELVDDNTISIDKKPKLDHLPPVTKSRVLLTPKRKTPSHLLSALKRKRATLIRPGIDGRGNQLILDFGKAFRMTIYFCPLLVTLRAMTKKEAESSGKEATKNISHSRGTSWTPLYHGLAEKESLSVWGVTGNYEEIGHVVEERLRDASNHATHVLRKCFRSHVKDKTTEFEVELLEGSALLEFLQLARTTYIPNWQDDDAD